jgi:hypothetical protein
MKRVRKGKRKSNTSRDWKALPFVLLGFIGAGLIVYHLWTKPAPTKSLHPTPSLDAAEPDTQDMDSSEPFSVPAEDTTPEIAIPSPALPDLPPLNESDAPLRQEALEITTHADFYTWVAPDELIRRFVAVVDNLAAGNSPARELEFIAPNKKFSATVNKDRQWVTHPKSFARYHPIANLFNSLNVESSLGLLRRWYPLFQEAYVELGYPDREFKEVLQRAIDELLATPSLEKSPILVQRTGRYDYEDPLLEGRSPAQRQLLRMGSKNVKTIKAKLREFRAGLANEVESILEK